MAADQCPFCLESIDGSPSARQCSREHVFLKALGGVTTTPVCKTCNEHFGAEVEGRLLGPHQILSIAKVAAGRSATAPGRLQSDGSLGEFDFRDGTMTFSRPISSHSTDTEQGLHIHAAPGQIDRLVPDVRRWASKHGLDPDLVERRLREAPRSSMGEDRFVMNHTIDLNLLGRLAAKVALVAGCRVTDDFRGPQPLADSLREIAWGRAEVKLVTGLDALQHVDAWLAGELAPALGVTAPRLTPEPLESQVVFMPGKDSTVVLVHLKGLLIPFAGVRCPGLPPAQWGDLPVLVRDAPGGAQVLRLQEWVLGRMHEQPDWRELEAEATGLQ